MTDPRSSDVDSQGNIKVVCRFRPVNDRESALNSAICVAFPPDQVTVSLVNCDSQGLKFTFDAVFPPDSEQIHVYEAAAKPTVEAVLEGFNGTVFAYGQTGSGKTYTMTGPDIDDERAKGVIPRMVETVFSAIHRANQDLEFTVKVGYAEIYMEKLKDLLEPGNHSLKVHEDKTRGVFIAGLTEEYVSSPGEIYALMKQGQGNREVGATLMNEGSSRSHSLFLMTISQTNKLDFSAKTGKLYLVDLAGSEKISKTGAEGKRLDEAKKINKSLSTLGLVINSLTDGKSTHVPYRDSKLTRVLQDSLGGNAKTALIITCSPSSYNEAETVSTLRFGIRAKTIRNKPKINREHSVAELKLLLAKAETAILQRDNMIALLRQRLVEAGGTLPTEHDLSQFSEETDKTENAGNAPDWEELNLELEQLRNNLDQLREEKAILMQENEKMKTEAEDGYFKLNQAGMKIKSLADQIQDLTSERDSLQAQKADLEAQFSIHSHNIETTEEEKWTNLLSVKDKEIDELKSSLSAKESILMTIESATEQPAVRQLCEAQRSLPRTLTSRSTMLDEELERSRKLAEENERLRKELETVVRHQEPGSEAIVASLTAAAVSKERQLWDQQASLYQRDLANRVEKVVQLEQELDNMKETNEMLVATLCQGDRGLHNHIHSLESTKRKLEIRCNRMGFERRELAENLRITREKVTRLETRLSEAELNFDEACKRLEELLSTPKADDSKIRHSSVRKVLKGRGKSSGELEEAV